MPHPKLTRLFADPSRAPRSRKARLRRMMARLAWADARLAALEEAQRRADQAWDRTIDAHPDWEEGDPELPPPPEAAILAEMGAATKHGRWPRKLYWSV